MLNTAKTRILAAQVATVAFVAGAVDRLRTDEEGQASAEYAGIIAVIVLIVGALAAFGDEIAQAVKGVITEQIDKIGD
ncbi:hypothetical protein [Georgenia sp. SYP-B2076]|uniref:hypothetical protein n=1 Tax=Georgenia sp. SYP-B2076 TaxID=2495881 RepID=UPI000F8F1A7C|nr:hypothetical protein [Georgenia sp. SYP-B2076]